MTTLRCLCAALIVAASAASLAAGGPPIHDNGEFLVDSGGRTLYVHGSTHGEVLGCSAACERLWPPFIAANLLERAPAGLSIIRRRDGRAQWAYRGQVLHLFGGEGPYRAALPGHEDWAAATTAN